MKFMETMTRPERQDLQLIAGDNTFQLGWKAVTSRLSLRTEEARQLRDALNRFLDECGNEYLSLIAPTKVLVSAEGIAVFNARWPCSELRSTRSYWFEFSSVDGDLIDTDVPEQDDGDAALALVEDCKAWLFQDTLPEWC